MRPTTGSLVVAPGRARRRVARRARAERRQIPQSRHARVASHAGNPGLYIHRSPNGSSLGAPPPPSPLMGPSSERTRAGTGDPGMYLETALSQVISYSA